MDAVIVDSRGADGTPPHPGDPTWEQLVGPVVDRFLHSLDPSPVGLFATFWDQETGRDQEVRVVRFDHPEEPAIAAGRPLFVIVAQGDKLLGVQASLLCGTRDGAPVPRYRRGRMALYNDRAGRAVVFDEDGERYAVEAVEDGYWFSATCWPIAPFFHVGMWLQPSGAHGLECGDAVPFVALQKLMCDDQAMHGLLRAFAGSITHSRGSVRRGSARDLERRLEKYNQDAVARFRKVLLEIELPPDASTRDAPMGPLGSAVLAEVTGKWGHRPS